MDSTVLSFHRHTNLKLHTFIRIQCRTCERYSYCDMPNLHVCECGGRSFQWDPGDIKAKDKLSEVPYVGQSVLMVDVNAPADPEVDGLGRAVSKGPMSGTLENPNLPIRHRHAIHQLSIE